MMHCCERMSEELARKCDLHPDRFECPDALVDFSPDSKSYGLIVHDGGSSVISIQYCPWCGAHLEKGQLLAEAERATSMLRGKYVKQVWRHRDAEIGIEFEDGSRLFVDAKSNGLDISIT